MLLQEKKKEKRKIEIILLVKELYCKTFYIIELYYKCFVRLFLFIVIPLVRSLIYPTYLLKFKSERTWPSLRSSFAGKEANLGFQDFNHRYVTGRNRSLTI